MMATICASVKFFFFIFLPFKLEQLLYTAMVENWGTLQIQVDNGSEFISKVVDKWAYENSINLDYSRPGKPTDNPFIESFNGSFRDECLNTHWFLSLEDAYEKINTWIDEYNHFRPHSSLNDQTPAEV